MMRVDLIVVVLVGMIGWYHPAAAQNTVPVGYDAPRAEHDITSDTSTTNHIRRAQQLPSIKGLRLIDADMDQPLKCFAGDCFLSPASDFPNFIDTDTLPPHISVEAILTGGTTPVAKSVRFVFTDSLGETRIDRIENAPAWALCGNSGPDFFACPNNTMILNSGTFSATPYTGVGGTGTAGPTFDAVVIFYTPAAPLVLFTLVNADTDTTQQYNMENGTTISLKATPRINILLDYEYLSSRSWTPVGVEFRYDGTAIVRNETKFPFAFYGNSGDDYFPFTPTLGNHTLEANVYKPPGKLGAKLTVWFTVVE